jgi:hypothetical protein
MKIITVLFVLIIGFTAYGQEECGYKQMTAKIDSIAKARNIENGIVKFHRVTSNGESSTTDSYDLTKKQKFSFDGQFMVMGNSYFNMNKLLFFIIRQDYIDFYFQGY